MRKPNYSPLIIVTLMFASFTVGLLVGRTANRNPVSVEVPAVLLAEPSQQQEEPSDKVMMPRTAFPIDINRADKDTFMELPGIGEVLAKRIVDYRSKHGHFKAVEELLNVEGMGKKKLDEIWNLITIGG